MYPNMLNILLAHLLMALVCSELLGTISRCPTNMERRLFGSHKPCQNNGIYHCMRDEKNELVETCNEPKRIAKGNFPIYLRKSDRIFYESCPEHLYQPFTVWSYEISYCEYKKSVCSGIGQVLYDVGSTTEDATCGCDNTKGYDINDLCKNMCMPGYERSVQNTCEPKSNTTRSAIREDTPSTVATIVMSAETNIQDEFETQLDNGSSIKMYYAFLVFVLLLIISCCIGQLLIQGMLELFPPCLLLAPLLVIITVVMKDVQVPLKIVFTVIALVVLLLTCCIVHHLFSTEMITVTRGPKVYNEEYDELILRLLDAASRGDLNTIKRLIIEDVIDMDSTDINGRSALHLAACAKQSKTVEYLVEHNLCSLEAKDRWNRSAYDDAKWHLIQYSDDSYIDILGILRGYGYRHQARNKLKRIAHAVKFVFQQPRHRKIKTNQSFKEIKAIELITAAAKDDIRTIQRLREMGTDMNLANSSGRTALHAAVENGMTNIVDYLINVCEVSPFVRWRDRRPIDIAITDEHDESGTITAKLRCYMSTSLEYNPEDVSETLPSQTVMIGCLLNCASRGDIKQMKRFKASGYKMDVCNYDSQTALHIAVMENQEHIVDFLLKECKQIDIALKVKDRWNMTPWEIAKKLALVNLKQIFSDNYPEFLETENDDIKTFDLLNAAARGDLSTLKSLHKENFDMNKRDHNGKTALHFAACANMSDAVKFLVQKAKVDISIPDRNNRLPMDEDINEEIQEIIKNDQYDQKEQNESKMSVQEETLVLVMKASSKGILHKQTDSRYKYFNMDSCNYDGDTPLHVAAANGKLEDVMYLLDKRKACLFVRNSFGKRPVDLVEEKLIFWKQRKSQTRNETMIEQLNKVKDLIGTAMHKAMGQHEAIEKNASFEKRSEEEKLFLFQNRIFKGDILAIRRFLKTDATLIDQLDYDERSALHIAAASGHTHLVEFLLSQGAERNKKDRYNLTPLDEAKMNGDDEMKHMLKD